MENATYEKIGGELHVTDSESLDRLKDWSWKKTTCGWWLIQRRICNMLFDELMASLNDEQTCLLFKYIEEKTNLLIMKINLKCKKGTVPK